MNLRGKYHKIKCLKDRDVLSGISVRRGLSATIFLSRPFALIEMLTGGLRLRERTHAWLEYRN